MEIRLCKIQIAQEKSWMRRFSSLWSWPRSQKRHHGTKPKAPGFTGAGHQMGRLCPLLSSALRAREASTVPRLEVLWPGRDISTAALFGNVASSHTVLRSQGYLRTRAAFKLPKQHSSLVLAVLFSLFLWYLNTWGKIKPCRLLVWELGGSSGFILC